MSLGKNRAARRPGVHEPDAKARTNDRRSRRVAFSLGPFLSSVILDPTDVLVTAGVSGFVNLVVSVLVPRYIERRDERREEDQTRLYSTLRKEMVSALEGKAGAMLGFGAYRPAEEMSEIRMRGVLPGYG
jgi:hypothetical protein